MKAPVEIEPKERIDVHAGHATYGQMSDLGRALNDEYHRIEKGEGDDTALIKQLIRILHPEIDPAITLANNKYVREIIDAVQYWKLKEGEMLKYEPSAEEKIAGYDSLAVKTGATGVAITIAEKFGVHNGPDEVFKWKYGTVFMILFTDLERHKFQKRLSEIRENKRKQREKTSRWSHRK